jgi:hypothetical protein
LCLLLLDLLALLFLRLLLFSIGLWLTFDRLRRVLGLLLMARRATAGACRSLRRCTRRRSTSAAS